MAQTKQFDTTSPNLWAQLAITILGLLSILGIQFPASPEQLGPDIATTISGGNFYAILLMLGTMVIMPVVNFIRSKPKPTLAAFFGNPNTWIYIVGLALGVLVVVGINIPGGTAGAAVGAAYAKDWAALASIVAINFLSPLIRWFAERKKKVEAGKSQSEIAD